MNEEEAQAPAEAPLPGSAELSPGTQRIFVRMAIWQTVIGVVGVFIGLVALYAALQESEAVRRQTAASVWPIVQFVMVDGEDGQGRSFALRFTNAGVGPARMRGLRMVLGGEPVRTWGELVAAAGGGPDAAAQRWTLSSVVLRPGEQLDAFATSESDLAAGLQRLAADPGSSLEYCYCSIFDDCWYVDSRSDGAAPEAVERCPDFGGEAFLN